MTTPNAIKGWVIGDTVPHYGKVVAIGLISGERYYFMSREIGTANISMIPLCAMPWPKSRRASTQRVQGGK